MAHGQPDYPHCMGLNSSGGYFDGAVIAEEDLPALAPEPPQGILPLTDPVPFNSASIDLHWLCLGLSQSIQGPGNLQQAAHGPLPWSQLLRSLPAPVSDLRVAQLNVCDSHLTGLVVDFSKQASQAMCSTQLLGGEWGKLNANLVLQPLVFFSNVVVSPRLGNS